VPEDLGAAVVSIRIDDNVVATPPDREQAWKELRAIVAEAIIW
jgi:hypothetical protein